MTEDQLRHQTLNLQRDTLKETQRHNVVTEGIQSGTLDESVRHNKVTEGIDMGRLSETTRHNVATEGIDMGKLSETTRHNLVSESVDMGNLAVKQQEADTHYQQLVESIRHNATTEDIDRTYKEVVAAVNQYKAKLDAEGLNLESEKLQNEINKWTSQLDETRRHNQTTEAQEWVDTGIEIVKTLHNLHTDKFNQAVKLLSALVKF